MEVDFPTVIAAKRELLQSKRLLVDTIKGIRARGGHSHPRLTLAAWAGHEERYRLLGLDLADIATLHSRLAEAGVDPRC